MTAEQDAVVHLHSETGRPVSSGLVARFLRGGLSPATIRKVMNNLERTGILEQPHLSAGRLPTDAGFRVFVDRLQSGWELRRHDRPSKTWGQFWPRPVRRRQTL